MNKVLESKLASIVFYSKLVINGCADQPLPHDIAALDRLLRDKDVMDWFVAEPKTESLKYK